MGMAALGLMKSPEPLGPLTICLPRVGTRRTSILPACIEWYEKFANVPLNLLYLCYLKPQNPIEHYSVLGRSSWIWGSWVAVLAWIKRQERVESQPPSFSAPSLWQSAFLLSFCRLVYSQWKPQVFAHCGCEHKTLPWTLNIISGYEFTWRLHDFMLSVNLMYFCLGNWRRKMASRVMYFPQAGLLGWKVKQF